MTQQHLAGPVRWDVGFTTGTRLERAAHWTTMILGGLLAAAVVAFAAPTTWYTPVFAAIAAILPVLALVDANTRLLPSVIIKPAAVTAVTIAVVLCAVGEGDWSQLAFGCVLAFVASGFYAAVWFAAPPGGFGFGDVRLAWLLGFTLGLAGPWPVFVGVLLLPLLIALPLAAAAALARRGTDEPATVPFGPAMCAAAFITMLHPDLFAAAVLGPMA